MAVGRYAPSPTGSLHLGNLRTALLAWLFARSAVASFHLRIDDLDPERSRERWIDEQCDDLRQIGIDWDSEPVRQSARSEIYEGALEALRDQGLLFECFCTRAEIRAASSAPHGPSPGAYPGTCLRLPVAELESRRSAGRPPALRVRTGGVPISFSDRLQGRFEGIVDDFVVRRNDGTHAYNLAVVVDDAALGVKEVVRGRDLIETTPRQLWLYRRLGLSEPTHAHVPLLVGPDGRRLAKRHGAVTLAERLAQGQTVDELRGELAASIGLYEPGRAPSLDQLLEGFDPARLSAGVGVGGA